MEDESRSESKPVGMRITSDPDHTEIEQPETFDAREMSSLPFRILLVSDLTPHAYPADWSAGAYVHRVDKNGFAAFIAEQAPTLTLEVPNTLSDTPKTWTVELQFDELKAFRPEHVARQVGPVAQLVEARDLVQAVGAGELDLDAFRQRLDALGIEMDWAGDLYQTLTGSEKSDEPESPASSGSDDSLDRLMGMVDMGDDASDAEPSSEPQPSTNGDVGSSDLMQALMDAVSGDEVGSAADASAVEQIEQQLGAAIGQQVAPIIAHEDFRQLEAAWRGLKFLVDRLNFRENIELAVLPAGRDDLHEAMHYQAIVPEHSDDHDAPSFSVIAVDQAFGRDHLDIEQLADLAGTGQSLQAPVLASVHAGFFGVEKISGLARLPALRPHLQGDAYVEWKALREEEASEFLGLALPAFMLRYPYGENRPVEGFELVEEESLMGGGALAVALAAAHSFADTGWPTHLDEYPIEDLPTQAVRGGQSPLAALLPGSKQSELARAGFIVLGAKPNHDAIRIVHAPTVRRPDTYDDPGASAEARAHASLRCRLFVARAAHHLLNIQDELEPGDTVEAVQRELIEAMALFMGVPVPEGEGGEEDEIPAVSVEHVTNVDLPEHELLAVRLQPPPAVMQPGVRLVMGLQVPKAK